MNYKYNLLQQKQDIITEMFESGKIHKKAYFELEEMYNKNKKLYTICLN